MEKPRLLTSLLDNLWVRMVAAYGHSWVSQYGTTPQGVTGDTWAATLSGMNGEQIANGICRAIAEGKDWPPSAGRFRAMCLNVPSFAAVALELKRRDGKLSPFARLMWAFVDSFRLSRADADRADKIMREAYDLAHEYVMQTGQLPSDPVADLEAPKSEPRTPASPETVARETAKMREVLGE